MAGGQPAFVLDSATGLLYLVVRRLWRVRSPPALFFPTTAT
jgi:hypothetical protein